MNGSKWWRFRYMFDGKAKTISLGTYPETSLSNARKDLLVKRELVQNGINPSDEKKAIRNEKKRKAIKADSNTPFTFKNLSTSILKERW